MKLVAFIIPPSVEILDLAGPMQVFTEAKSFGLKIGFRFYAIQPDPVCSAGLSFGKIENYKHSELKKGDYLFLPGVDYEYLKDYMYADSDFLDWIKKCAGEKINICSVCNAAFVLAAAGLLENKKATTHWRRTEEMQKMFPDTRVLSDVLYVKEKNIYTSAGISAGIDLSLAILEEIKNPAFVTKVARNLVVYHRRGEDHSQESIYLDYRNHINPKIHEVQDYIVENLSENLSLEILAEKVFISPRNLSRIFKKTTGLTLGQYIKKLRLEKAKTLRNNPDFTIEFIASEIGFKTPRQLQKLLKNEKDEKNDEK